MIESLRQEIDQRFSGKGFLTTEDICTFLSCDEAVVYNWNKRVDPRRRPPRIQVGKELRFPKYEFVKWLAEEQT